MRKATISILLLTATLVLQAQDYLVQDSAAKVILDKASTKLTSYKTIMADFELIMENRAEDFKTSSSGAIQIKGDKYYLESLGSQVYFDGKTMWSYTTDINEVTITEPEAGESDFVDNPALIFTFYNRDFKYRLIGEANVDHKWMYEIDLYPKNLNQPYSKFKLFIEKNNHTIYMVKAVSKEIMDYTIYITNSRFDLPIKEDQFTFVPADHPDIEIVDMRF